MALFLAIPFGGRIIQKRSISANANTFLQTCSKNLNPSTENIIKKSLSLSVKETFKLNESIVTII